MERKHYLELCQKNAVKIESVFVEYNGSKYIPVALSLWFNEKGEGQNTAVMSDLNKNSIINCRLQDVVCVDK